MISRIFVTIIGIISLLFLGFIAIQLLKVPKVTKEDCLSVTGTIETIREVGKNDIVFQLNNQEDTYYINRGLELGLEIDQLKKQLTGKIVTIKYPQHWATSWSSNHHLSLIRTDHQVIFDETIY